MHSRPLNLGAPALAVVLASGLLGGCGAHRASETTMSHASPIISGVPSPSPGDDAVVLLRHTVLGTEAVCSGTLIAPNLVVTARHCVAYVTDGTYQCSVRGELIEGADGGGHTGTDVPASAIEIHVGEMVGAAPAAPAALGKQVVSTLSLTACIDDLAFVVLDRPLSAPPVSLRLDRQTRVGEIVTLIGYGKQDDGPFDWHTTSRKKLPGRVITAVGPDSAEGIVPTVVPRTFDISGPSVCEGDSGGPALSEKTGALIGAYSNKNSGICNNPDIVQAYVNLPPFQALALQAFAAAGAEPMREPPGLSMGEVCADASDCTHGDCVTASDGTSRCSVICGAGAACPAGYSCLAAGDAAGKFCMPDALPSCPCGSPSCSPCDAGSGAPLASADDGCTIVRAKNRAGVWPGACFVALFTCRRARSLRRARSRCRTRTRTAG